MVPTPAQYHHYIPRFILRTFADNFSLITSNTEHIVPSTPGVFEPIVKQGGADCTIELNDTARAYGIYDMYRDIDADDEMKFQKLLSSLESASATFIRKIWSGEDLSLTRAQLSDMKKFLCIMRLRLEGRRGQYYNIQFDLKTLFSIKKHMEHNNIKKVQDVWFDNLKWLIETPVDRILVEYDKVVNIVPDHPFASSLQYQGPIHVTELMDFGYMASYYVCIWQAEEGSEFILSDNCFGAFESDKGYSFHDFFIVSPRYAIVLVSRMYMLPNIDVLPLRKSWFSEKLHSNSETVYAKGPLPKNVVLKDHYSPDDVLKYRRIVVPKQDVYKVNSILLDCRSKSLTYKSPVNMLKSLRFYDRVKSNKVLFTFEYDYTILKRKLFADLNRTHSS
ncbi:MAG: hypothetical protein J3R72DRAFT_521711 [Linnemannia gamsii]|nr:MAG: hypothetical protein J3R72DRAFT_521711 [Linnemannia gamsii]